MTTLQQSFVARPHGKTPLPIYVYRCFVLLSIAAATYLGALFLIFPGYVHPLSPFHADFFDYVSMAAVPAKQILTTYPRPLAFLAMHLMGGLGVKGLLAAEIPLCIITLLLVRSYVRTAFQMHESDYWQFAFYSLALFAEPQFYFEYRHDLPYLIELAFFMIAMLLWMYALRSRAWLPCAFAVLFAFASCLSKETLYLTGPFLLALNGLLDPAKRRLNVLAALVLVAIEGACRFWDLHVGAAFAGSGDSSSPYYVSFALPGLVMRLAGFLLLTVSPVVLSLLALVLVKGKQRTAMLGLVAAAVLALVPNAALPNHFIEEYAWAAAPFACAPILLFRIPKWPRFVSAALFGATLFALFALRGRADATSQWMVYQEQKTTHIFDSVRAFAALPAQSRVLVFPPRDAPFAYWLVPNYVDTLPNGLDIEVFDPGDTDRLRKTTARVGFGGLDDFDPRSINNVAVFSDDGRLASVREVLPSNCALAAAVKLFPDLSRWVGGCALRQIGRSDTGRLLASLTAVGDWRDVIAVSRSQPDSASAGAASLLARRRLSESSAAGALTSSPDRIVSRNGRGSATIAWHSNTGEIEVHTGSADGPIVARSGTDGSKFLKDWITDGTRLVLISVAPQRSVLAEHTLRVVAPDGRPWHGIGLYADPDSLSAEQDSGNAVVTIYWDYPSAVRTQVRLNSPDGPLFAEGQGVGSAVTGPWVRSGQRFYLQDLSKGSPGRTVSFLRVSVHR